MGEVTPAYGKKRCSRCKRTKDVSQFGVSRHAPDGLNYWCRTCKKAAWKREFARKKKLKRFGEQLLLDLPLKQCGACTEFKSIDDFGVDSAKRDGRMIYCRKCVKAKMAEAWIRRRDSIQARNRAWAQANKRRMAELANRRVARRKEATFVPFTKEDLAAKWAYWGGKCWVCGTIATATDHVKPLAKGGAHMLCNLRPICQPCNSSKGAQWPFDKEMIRCGAA
jgi:5-methylcytosine-specific restriction endonuclease McrA